MRIRFIIISLLLLYKSVGAQKDTSLHLAKGWLLYWNKGIIWLPADVDKDVKAIKFLAQGGTYGNGLLVNYANDARLFKLVAESFAVKTENKGVQTLDSIRLIPVLVKYKNGFQADEDSIEWHFIRDSKDLIVRFKGNQDYDIREIELLRQSDKAKLKKLKNLVVEAPN